MVKFIVAASVLVLAGCASQRPDLSQEEWKIKEYKNHNKEEVIAAAREVIRLSDPSEISWTGTLKKIKQRYLDRQCAKQSWRTDHEV